ncbi:hypothetical protein F2Q70_00031764 [Brassica cretica]|uniref:Uncharacterized protein n=1 Tax=Brassica cretica TaxID=69181 RepID=A0A8S9FH62_BRACR|nr:hypothetical protein F2Q70_00031764 [Brassica cretica]
MSEFPTVATDLSASSTRQSYPAMGRPQSLPFSKGFAAFSLTRLIGYASPYVQALSATLTLVFVAILMKLYVNWFLARVVVVVESASGSVTWRLQFRSMRTLKTAGNCGQTAFFGGHSGYVCVANDVE